LSGIVSLALGVIALAASDRSLVLPMLGFSAVAVLATGLAGLLCPGKSRLSDPGQAELRIQPGFARLCIGAGIVQVGALFCSTTVAVVTGIALGICLLVAGTRRRSRRTDGRRRRRGRRAKAGTTVLAVLVVVLIFNSCLAVAITISSDPGGASEPPKSERPNPKPGETDLGGDASALPTYAELCPLLPDPREIGHGLGELFEEDDAIKAGCGTEAVRVADTGTWVAAGMCSGERRSVAVSAPGLPPVITYGQASEFIWAEAHDGGLVAVEAAAPAGGDVVLVETRHGTYGFARSKRSAVAGNANARSCQEVGGVAEPFARIPPPLLVLWTELVHDDATWYWPTYDQEGETEAVVFISTEAVDQGECVSDSLCRLEIDGIEHEREGGEFTKIAALSEFMPTE
jgi:hypothetical protein